MGCDFEAVRNARTISLTTYKRDGTPVGTPVSIAFEGDRAFSRSYDKAWKTKRLRHNPHVQVAASTMRGRRTGPSYRCSRNAAGGRAGSRRRKGPGAASPAAAGRTCPAGSPPLCITRPCTMSSGPIPRDPASKYVPRSTNSVCMAGAAWVQTSQARPRAEVCEAVRENSSRTVSPAGSAGGLSALGTTIRRRDMVKAESSADVPASGAVNVGGNVPLVAVAGRRRLDGSVPSRPSRPVLSTRQGGRAAADGGRSARAGPWRSATARHRGHECRQIASLLARTRGCPPPASRCRGRLRVRCRPGGRGPSRVARDLPSCRWLTWAATPRANAITVIHRVDTPGIRASAPTARTARPPRSPAAWSILSPAEAHRCLLSTPPGQPEGPLCPGGYFHGPVADPGRQVRWSSGGAIRPRFRLPPSRPMTDRNEHGPAAHGRAHSQAALDKAGRRILPAQARADPVC